QVPKHEQTAQPQGQPILPSRSAREQQSEPGGEDHNRLGEMPKPVGDAELHGFAPQTRQDIRLEPEGGQQQAEGLAGGFALPDRTSPRTAPGLPRHRASTHSPAGRTAKVTSCQRISEATPTSTPTSSHRPGRGEP